MDTDFRARLEELRCVRKLTQQQLADRVGVSSGHMSKVSTGVQPPSLQLVRRIDQALDAKGELITRAQLAACGACVREPLVRPGAGNEGGQASILSQANGRSTQPGGGDLVSAVARDASEHAECSEATEVGPGALRNLQASVQELARTYVSATPAPMFTAMESTRRRILATLDRKSHPSQQVELHLLAGAVCILLANAAVDLGHHHEGAELARTGWTYGSIIGHRELMAWAHGTQALAALLDQCPRDAIDHAEEGLALQSTGPGAARLLCLAAKAWTMADAPDQALAALAEATRVRAEHCDADLAMRFGGEFTFDNAKQAYYAATILIGSDELERARTEATTAINLYEARPAHDRSYGCLALARSQLALAHLKAAEIEQAGQALVPVLTLEPARRIFSITRNLDTGRQILNGAQFRNSGSAKHLRERISVFLQKR